MMTVYLYFLIDEEFLHTFPVTFNQAGMVKANPKCQGQFQVGVFDGSDYILHLKHKRGGCRKTQIMPISHLSGFLSRG